MKEHGLLLSAPMIRALAAGRKTQTRRAVAAHNSEVSTDVCDWRGVTTKTWNALGMDLSRAEARTTKSGRPFLAVPAGRKVLLIRPHIQVGHRLWWKETWAETESDAGPVIAYRAGGSRIHCVSGESRLGNLVNYLGPDPDSGTYEVDRWKSSMFMPRWAARYSNTVTRVLAERIQSISEADSLAEGIAALPDEHDSLRYGIACDDGQPGGHGWPWREWLPSARFAYFELWRRINGAESLNANPWVWGYEWEASHLNEKK